MNEKTVCPAKGNAKVALSSRLANVKQCVEYTPLSTTGALGHTPNF